MATGDDTFSVTVNYLHEVYFTFCCYSALFAFKTYCSVHKAKLLHFSFPATRIKGLFNRVKPCLKIITTSHQVTAVVGFYNIGWVNNRTNCTQTINLVVKANCSCYSWGQMFNCFQEFYATLKTDEIRLETVCQCQQLWSSFLHRYQSVMVYLNT